MSPINMTEKVRLTLDGESRLVSYRLCLPERTMSEHDESPLRQLFKGQTPVDILKIPVEDFCECYPAEDDWLQVIFMRQFLGLRAILEWLTGLSGNICSKFCSLSSTKNGDGSEIIEGEINFGYAIAKIAACRYCQGCHQRRPTAKRKV